MMTFEQAKACVLYEDNHLLVVCKPVNMPVQADASGDEDLLTAMKAYVKQAYNKPGEVYLGLVHRLDRPVGGAMVFARTSKAAQRLTEQVKSRKMGRTYWAVVRGNPPESGKLSHFLLKDERTNTTRAVPEGTAGAKPALLEYRVLDRKNGLSLLSDQTANRAVAPDPGAVFDGKLAALGRCALRWRQARGANRALGTISRFTSIRRSRFRCIPIVPLRMPFLSQLFTDICREQA